MPQIILRLSPGSERSLNFVSVRKGWWVLEHPLDICFSQRELLAEHSNPCDGEFGSIPGKFSEKLIHPQGSKCPSSSLPGA